MYHLFAGENMYPRGGMSDYVGSFPTLAEAHNIGTGLLTNGTSPDEDGYRSVRNWYQIATVQNDKLVEVGCG